MADEDEVVEMAEEVEEEEEVAEMNVLDALKEVRLLLYNHLMNVGFVIYNSSHITLSSLLSLTLPGPKEGTCPRRITQGTTRMCKGP
jgi:hypothetical protein